MCAVVRIRKSLGAIALRNVVIDKINLTKRTGLRVSSPVSKGAVCLVQGEVCHDKINDDRLGRAIAIVGANVGVPNVPVWAVVRAKPTQVAASDNGLHEVQINSLRATHAISTFKRCRQRRGLGFAALQKEAEPR
eukprot:1272207-Pleurochrysis_carterae.AAC.3